MRSRTTIAGVALTAAAVLGAAGCSSQPSYNQIAANCAKALAKRPDGDKAKPAACNGLKEKDYDTLVLDAVINKSGLVDKNGNVDVGKLLGTPAP